MPRTIKNRVTVLEPVNRHTRASKNDGRVIVCPKCNGNDCIYHFTWSALICKHCNSPVNKYEYLVYKTYSQ